MFRSVLNENLMVNFHQVICNSRILLMLTFPNISALELHNMKNEITNPCKIFRFCI